MDLKEKAKNLPAVPGVYLMKDSQDNIIYVGKSKKLKNRVSSYFQNTKGHVPKVEKMVRNIRNFEYIVMDTEFEAFLLECKLIKELQPTYNKKMKNDKAYVYIKVSTAAECPNITICTEFLEDDNIYFGPYTSRGVVERAIEGIKISYSILCNVVAPRASKRKSYCLNYSLGLCIGICGDSNAEEEYVRRIHEIAYFIGKKDKTIFHELVNKMKKAAESLDFIKAAQYRDYIEAIQYILDKGKVLKDIGRGRNIVAIEVLEKNKAKYFLIKDNKVLYKSIITIEEIKSEAFRKKIIEEFTLFFLQNKEKKAELIRREEIDEAQIIYSYLKGTNTRCKYKVIPQKWIKDKNYEKLFEIQSFFIHILENQQV